MSGLWEKLGLAVFFIIGLLFFIDQTIITTSDIENPPGTDGEFLIAALKAQREGNYQILREFYNKFSDEQILLIAKCQEEKLFEFIKTSDDYDVPLPYFKSQEDMNNHFVTTIQRKIKDSEISLEWYAGIAQNQCLGEVMEGIYE